MERGWIETIQLLGLDFVLLATLALAGAEWAQRRLGRLALRRREAVARTTDGGPARAAGATPGLAWPPAPWRTSH